MDRAALEPLIAWPLMLLAAWLAGEWVFRHLRLPRVCAYGVVGLALGGFGTARDAASHAALAWLADVALGLTLFELGYRINPRWFRRNPWVPVTALLQAALVFCAVFAFARWLAVPPGPRLVIAALCVATSPAAVMRITHEWHSAGQVTERLVHLCALNCLLAVLALKLVVGYWHLRSGGAAGAAAYQSLYVIALSLVAGGAFGVVAPWLNRLATTSRATTVTFAFLVLLLGGVARSLDLSPLLASLAFGIVARERRIVLGPAQRDFGALGDVLAVFLFVFIGSLLSWRLLADGLVLGLGVVAVRAAVHVAVNAALARPGGTTVRKGALAGLALTPMSAFALMLLEETRLRGVALADESLPLLVGLLMLLDVLGPLATQRALRLAGETRPEAA